MVSVYLNRPEIKHLKSLSAGWRLLPVPDSIRKTPVSAFVAARGIGLDILGGEPRYLWGHQVIAFSSLGLASSASQTGFLSQVPVEHISLHGQLELCPDCQPSDSFIYRLAVPWGPIPITGTTLMTHTWTTDMTYYLQYLTLMGAHLLDWKAEPLQTWCIGPLSSSSLHTFQHMLLIWASWRHESHSVLGTSAAVMN